MKKFIAMVLVILTLGLGTANAIEANVIDTKIGMTRTANGEWSYYMIHTVKIEGMRDTVEVFDELTRDEYERYLSSNIEDNDEQNSKDAKWYWKVLDFVTFWN